MTGANVAEQAVSVSIEDVAPDDWTEKVYKPDIVGKPCYTLQEARIQPSLTTGGTKAPWTAFCRHFGEGGSRTWLRDFGAALASRPAYRSAVRR